MIVIVHKHNKIVEILDFNTKEIVNIQCTTICDALFKLAKLFDDRLIVWCHHDLKEYIDHEGFRKVFHHKLIMASFSTRNAYYIDERIGYVESSPFINVNKEVKYPTWLMSSCIGGVNSDVLSCYNQNDYENETFDYVLNSLAKRGMANGLFCYSSPQLLTNNRIAPKHFKPSKYELFKFIRQHYKGRWAFLTLFNSLVYEKRLL